MIDRAYACALQAASDKGPENIEQLLLAKGVDFADIMVALAKQHQLSVMRI